MELLGHIVVLFLVFEKPPYCFPQELHQFTFPLCVQFSSVAQSCLTLWHHGLQHARPPCPSPTPRVYSDSCPLSQWCHLTISSSVIPFSSCLQSLLALGSFLMSQLFASGGQSIRVSASGSVLPVNTQDWSPLEWTGWISLQSKGLSRDFSHTTVQKHQFFCALYSPTLTSIPFLHSLANICYLCSFWFSSSPYFLNWVVCLFFFFGCRVVWAVHIC